LLVTPSFDLSGRVALVTGAGRGLGRGAALGLAHVGADVALVSRSAAELEAVAAEVQALGRTAWCLTEDLSDVGRAGALADAVATRCGPVHIVAHFAGTQRRRPALEITEDDWQQVLAVNLAAPYFLSCRLAERMHAGGIAGRHIFVGSLTSRIGIRNVAPYAASKSGLMGVVRTLAVEWAAAGTTVNAVIPGYFETELTKDAFADPERSAWIRSRIPMGRIGQADDLVGAVVFLASDAARYITGQSIVVDGGWLGA
jgi:NAD(P)-dependent dehydrogenase (short-subunit alcohol dehydrogenase family)